MSACGPLAARAGEPIACTGADATQAINAALGRGGTVLLSAGICVISSSLHVRGATRLSGAGMGRTILRAAELPDFGMVVVGGTTQAAGANDVDVSNLSIDAGNTQHIGVRESNALTVNWSSQHVSIHDIETYDAGMNGIEVRASGTVVARSRVHDNQANGIYILGKGHPGWNDTVVTSQVRITGNIVSDNSRGRTPAMRHGWDGIDVDIITRDCLVDHNTVVGNDIIVFENAQVVRESTGHRIIDNLIENVTQGDAGIDILGPETGFEIAGNTIRRVLGWGIVVNGPVRDGRIAGNTVSLTTASGIEIRDTGPTARRGPPTGIAITGNSVAAVSGQHAIAILHRATNVSVRGNVLRGSAPASLIDAAGAGPGLTVADNR